MYKIIRKFNFNTKRYNITLKALGASVLVQNGNLKY